MRQQLWAGSHARLSHTSKPPSPRGAILDFDLLGSPHSAAPGAPSALARPRLDEAFAAAAEQEQEDGRDPVRRARLAAIPAQPLSPSEWGRRIDHLDDLPH